MVTVTEKRSKVNEVQALSLDRAKNGTSLKNFPIIIAGFVAMGLSESEIKPRNNVFTYQAWRAQGRQVRKGQHGVKIRTFIPVDVKEKDEKTDDVKIKTVNKRRNTTVFHITQTDETGGAS